MRQILKKATILNYRWKKYSKEITKYQLKELKF